MALNAYIPQDSGNLKYVAEDEQATPEQLAEFLEALQEALTGKSKDGPFVIIDIDAGFSAYVEFADEEVTEVPRVSAASRDRSRAARGVSLALSRAASA
jgi:hypothetical protein